jgi:hypothetical protein
MQHINHRWTVLSSLLIVASILVSGCQAQTKYTPLSASSPFVQLAEGLALSVNPAALSTAPNFGVQLAAVPEATFADTAANAAWSKARQALPATLRKLSPVFQIKTTGTLPAQMFLSIVIPPEAGASFISLYAWDGQHWSFLPAHSRGGQLIADVVKPPAALGLFATAPAAPQTFVAVEPGEKLSSAAGIDAVLLGGVSVQADGSLTGALPNLSSAQSVAAYPVIRDYTAAGPQTDVTARLLTDTAVRANHLQALVSFSASTPYAGIALDYRGVASDQRAAYAQFVSDLAQQLHAQGKKLIVSLPAPVPQPDAALDRDRFVTGSYDWRAIGAAADTLLIPPAQAPADFGNGTADALLTWAAGEVERGRLWLLTSAADVDGANGTYKTVLPADALSHFGTAAATANTVTSGQAVTLTLSGKAQNLAYDQQAFAMRFTYSDNGNHTLWLTSAGTLGQRLALASKYGLGGVAVSELAAPGISADLFTALAQYKTQAAATAHAQAQVVWTVKDASGATAQATALPNLGYVYVPKAPGNYQFSAQLQGGDAGSLGSVQVAVANPATPTPTPKPTARPYVAPAAPSSDNSGPAATAPATGGNTGSFVPPPPVTGGSFELGGQVPGFIAHGAQMHQAKMTWVKFQATCGGDASGAISGGHAAGFKVLISAAGTTCKDQVTNPSYWDTYAAWVGGMAAQGADAIEIWNEANLDREWPTGQISGATYTELLKRAYAAIKAAHSSTIVISGAPAPTGAEGAFPGSVVNDDHFLQQMAAAGAANYMDCVGVHFNDGTTSPNATSGSALSGYHYSYYYQPMVDLYYGAFGGSRQLCFTELGYVSPQGFGFVPSNFGWAANTTVAEQAQWLAETASLAGSSGKVRLMIVFNVDFTQYLANDPQAGYAIMRPDGTCPACSTLSAVMP